VVGLRGAETRPVCGLWALQLPRPTSWTRRDTLRAAGRSAQGEPGLHCPTRTRDLLVGCGM
jgi:hypothetical protein